MNPIAALLLEKVIEYLLTPKHIEDFITKLIEHIPNYERVPGLPEAIGRLKVDTSPESLEDLGTQLEATGAMEPEKFAALLVNQASVPV